MKCYIITYDIKDPARQKTFKEKLKNLEGYCPVHDNCWAILTEQTAAQLRDSLTSLLDAADRIFIVKSGTEAGWKNSYGKDNDEWLKRNL